MKIAIESQQKLSNNDLETIVGTYGLENLRN